MIDEDGLTACASYVRRPAWLGTLHAPTLDIKIGRRCDVTCFHQASSSASHRSSRHPARCDFVVRRQHLDALRLAPRRDGGVTVLQLAGGMDEVAREEPPCACPATIARWPVCPEWARSGVRHPTGRASRETAERRSTVRSERLHLGPCGPAVGKVPA